MSELNTIYEEASKHILYQCIGKGQINRIGEKKTQYEKRKEMQKIQRELVAKVNESFAEEATITLLTEGESKSTTESD